MVYGRKIYIFAGRYGGIDMNNWWGFMNNRN